MLENFFVNHADFSAARISETFESLRLSLRINTGLVPFCHQFFDQLKTISVRDRFEVFVEVGGNDLRIANCSNDTLNELNEFLADFSTAASFEIDLTLRKTRVDSTISVYFLSAFVEYLRDEPLQDVLKTFSDAHEGTLRFEVFGDMQPIRSRSIEFYSSGSPPYLIAASSEVLEGRAAKLQMLEENAVSTNVRLKLLPEDFAVRASVEWPALVKFFNSASASLSVVFIANSSDWRGSRFSYKIHGYRTVAADGLDPSALADEHEALLRISSWAYDGANTLDKVGLVRNVVSLHANSAGVVRFDNTIWTAIQSNYQIYLKDNVESYLEVKNKLGEFIVDSTARTYAMADEMVDSFKNSVLAIITFLLTVVLVNGLKDTGELTVFSDAYFAVVLLLSILSFCWLIMSRVELIRRFDNASSTISVALKLNYEKVLLQAEIDDSINPVVKANREYLKKQIKRYSWWWFLMLVVFVAAFGCANYTLAPPKAQSKSEGNEKVKVKVVPLAEKEEAKKAAGKIVSERPAPK